MITTSLDAPSVYALTRPGTITRSVNESSPAYEAAASFPPPSQLRVVAVDPVIGPESPAHPPAHPTADSPDSATHDVGIAEAAAVHAMLRKLHTTGNNVRLRFLVVLQMLHDDNLFRELGYTSFPQYCDREFGLPRSTALEYLRTAKALNFLPRIRVLFGEGHLSWHQVRAITRVATVQSELRWIEFAVTEKADLLVPEVQEAQRTGRDAPRENRNGLPNLLARLTIDMTLEDKERVATAFKRVDEAMEASATDMRTHGIAGANGTDSPGVEPVRYARHPILLWADGVLSGVIPVGPPAPGNGGQPAAPASPAQTIIYHSCPGCRAATVETENGLVSVYPQRIEELAAQSNVIAISAAEERDVEVLPPGEVDQPNSAALSRKVLNRDGGRCSNPGCGNRLKLHAHHIVFRSAGGPTALANEVAVCDLCHAMVHSGLLEVSGSPYTGLKWIPRPLNPSAKLRDAEAVCTRAREIAIDLPIDPIGVMQPISAGVGQYQPTARAPHPRLPGVVAAFEVSPRRDTLKTARQSSRPEEPPGRLSDLAAGLKTMGYSRSESLLRVASHRSLHT